MTLQTQFLQIFTKLLVLTGLLLGSLSYALAADLVVSPATGSYSAGQTFTATVRAVPGGDSVNAVEATMSFDSDNLAVVSVNKTGSIFSLWTTEPTFSNAAGTITFGGGSPTPFTSTSNILSITFRTIGEGDGAVSFTRASVLAADGRGTDVYENGIGATYTVAVGTTPTPTPIPTPTPTPEPTANPEPESSNENDDAIIFGDPPRPPEIGSPLFLDPEIWYSKVDGVFSWTLPFDVTAVAIEVSDDPLNVPQDNPDAIIEPPDEEFVVSADNITDGVQYISINFENQVGWGSVLNRQLKIDTTAPQPFLVVVTPGPAADAFPLLNFAANDVTSGIDYYEMTIADKEPINVTPDEAALGYLLRELEDGTYTVSVIAHDMAGNTRESSAAVLITSGWTKPLELEDEGSFWDFFTGNNILIFFLFLMVVLLVVYVWYEHKVLHAKEEKLRRETREIQDQMEKIFSALRDEIYDQINHITKRKRMSAKEKEAVESLTQALEVSETLIEKEISDVKSILR